MHFTEENITNAKLSFREHLVLTLRYGLDGEKKHTFREIGKKLTKQSFRRIEIGGGVSDDRARQIFNRAFRKIQLVQSRKKREKDATICRK